MNTTKMVSKAASHKQPASSPDRFTLQDGAVKGKLHGLTLYGDSSHWYMRIPYHHQQHCPPWSSPVYKLTTCTQLAQHYAQTYPPKS